MAMYKYRTESTIEYMEQYMDVFHHQMNIYRRFRPRESTKNVLEALTKKLTFDTLDEDACNPTYNNFSVASKSCPVNEDTTQMESDILNHPVEKSDQSFVRMHLLNHLSDHISQLGNFINVSSKLPETAMMDLN